MFIYNLKINHTKIIKIIITLLIIFVIFLIGFIAYKIYQTSINSISSCNKTNIQEINNKNYTNILKTVHENIDDYIGQNFSYTGYIYRVYDLKDNQFVLARNMIISSDLQTVVVGFLCEDTKKVELENYTWVEINGIIQKYKYHGYDLPLIKINNIKQIEKPVDEYVYPPDNNYIPTSTII